MEFHYSLCKEEFLKFFLNFWIAELSGLVGFSLFSLEKI